MIIVTLMYRVCPLFPRVMQKVFVLAVFLAIPSVLFAGVASGHLELDGVLKVKGMPLAGARMLMVQHDGAQVAMDHGLEHFSLTLDLNSEYLLEFTHEGCVTKQVLIDTRVPTGDFIFRSYGFPFQLTLQPPPSGQVFAYSGPVARVYFSTAIDDFSYDKDYRAKASPALVAAMAQAKRDPAPVTPAAVVNTSSSLPVASRHLENEAPLVHSTMPSREVAVVRERGIGMLNVRAAPMKPVPLAPRALRSSRVHATTSRPAQVRLDEPAIADAAPAAAAIMDKGSDRQEELVVEKLRVTKIVRIVDQGRVTEYRRVEDHIGAVYYFRNGLSCTQVEYELGAGK